MIRRPNTPPTGHIFDTRFTEMLKMLAELSGDEAVRRPLAMASILVETAAYEAARNAPSERVSRLIAFAVELERLAAEPDSQSRETY